MSEAKKGHITSKETRQKLSIAAKGRKHTKKTKLKISEMNKGRILSNEARKRISKAAKGRKHTKETKLKISEAQKKRWARERQKR